MGCLTRLINPVCSPGSLRSLLLHGSFTKFSPHFSQTISPLPCSKVPMSLQLLQFTSFSSQTNFPSYNVNLPESDPSSGNDDSRSERSDSSKGRKVELPEELSKIVMLLTCKSSAEGGSCNVYVVGTMHVSEKSCREVKAVISYLKPEVVFLELCKSRVAVLTSQKLRVPTMEEMVDKWKKNQNIFGIILSWFFSKVGSSLGVVPGSEFRVAFEEANMYGGKVILGDRPIQITLTRTWRKMPLWHKTKFLCFTVGLGIFMPSGEFLKKMLKGIYGVDMMNLSMEGMREHFPTLVETLVDERDQYMSVALLRYARRHSSVVAVVGKGHLPGIKKYWKRPVSITDLSTIPPKPNGKILKSLGIAAAGVAIISGIYHFGY